MFKKTLLVLLSSVLIACGGGDGAVPAQVSPPDTSQSPGDSGSGGGSTTNPPDDPPTETDPPEEPPEEPPTETDPPEAPPEEPPTETDPPEAPPEDPTDDVVDVIASQTDAARLLTQGTFGPSMDEVNALVDQSSSQWFINQVAEPASLLMPVVDEFESAILGDDFFFFRGALTTIAFWRNAITGEDQLRQRVAFALSEILVVSNVTAELEGVPQAIGTYEDILISQAFGNYRDILEAITYSPAMGTYLTFIGNQRGDPETGRMPDENYARELLQLFTLGLVALNDDGTPQLDDEGNPIELYDNTDITGLARVFTGLNFDFNFEPQEGENELATAFSREMTVLEEFHSEREKSFLGLTIPANTDARTSITTALDHIFAQPSIGPFVSRQLIQRLVSSAPSASYIERVTQAFNSGSFTLPNNTQVGEGRKGDLTATVAAILFDPEARNDGENLTFGKVREPILRFTHWTRAFNVERVTPEFMTFLYEVQQTSRLGQHPYRSPSVFNFFRPGYVAPGSITGEQGLTMPELQLMNASTVPGYANFMTLFITAQFSTVFNSDIEEDISRGGGIDLDFSFANESFLPDYSAELALASEPSALLDRLDLLLTAGNLSDATRENITQTLQTISLTGDEDPQTQLTLRVQLAILMVMTSPDYLVQR